MNDVQNEGGATPAPASQPAPKSNTKWIIIGVVILLVLFLLGRMFSPERAVERMIEESTGGAYDVDVSRDGTVKMVGGDGESVNMAAGENVSLPKDWPASVPVMPGATITYALSVNSSEDTVGHNVSFEVSEPVSAVAEYYTQELEAAGWTIQANLSTGEGYMFTASNDADEGVVVNIGPGDEGTAVNLSVETNK